MNKNSLRKLKLNLIRRKPKATFLTVKEIREILINGEDIPTAINSATKTDYIVKPRTVFGPKVKIKKRGWNRNV